MKEQQTDWSSVKNSLVEIIAGYDKAALGLVGADRDHILRTARDLEAALSMVSRGTEAANPIPSVNLPERPTLGWLTDKYGGSALGTWERYESQAQSRAGEASALVRERDLPLEDVAEFVEATAVPKAALDELREKHAGGRQPSVVECGVSTFLVAIDAANGDHA